MKITWGKGFTIAMIAFMSFILYMVFTLMATNTDLESEDYYQKEIEFETEIKAVNNTNKLNEKVKVSQNEDFLMVQFPNLENMDSLSVFLFRPNNEKEDQLFTIEDSKTLMIPNKKLKIGSYNLKIQFKIKDELYMQKESVKIQ